MMFGFLMEQGSTMLIAKWIQPNQEGKKIRQAFYKRVEYRSEEIKKSLDDVMHALRIETLKKKATEPKIQTKEPSLQERTLERIRQEREKIEGQIVDVLVDVSDTLIQRIENFRSNLKQKKKARKKPAVSSVKAKTTTSRKKKTSTTKATKKKATSKKKVTKKSTTKRKTKKKS